MEAATTITAPEANVDAEGSTVQTSTGEPDVAGFTDTPIAVEAATTITAPEVSATLSVPNEPIIGLTPAQDELTSVSHPVMERGSESTSAEFSPVNDIMKELARQMVQQFFASMRSCIDLILSGGSSFEFFPNTSRKSDWEHQSYWESFAG